MLEVEGKITRFLYDYVRFIDDDRLEEWVDLFVEDAVYRIVPRENLRFKPQLPIVYCENKNMLRDRIMALRTSSIYSLHYDRHIISNVCVIDEAMGVYTVHANYVVYQTDVIEAQTSLFSAGKYEDEIIFVGNMPKLKAKTVILDTCSVQNDLSTPL